MSKFDIEFKPVTTNAADLEFAANVIMTQAVLQFETPDGLKDSNTQNDVVKNDIAKK